MVAFVLSSISTFAFFCCVFCGYKSLKVAIDVIDAAADFLSCTKRILFIPFLYFIFLVVILSIWAYGYACVISLNQIEANTLIP
jgi:hypothetical protein